MIVPVEIYAAPVASHQQHLNLQYFSISRFVTDGGSKDIYLSLPLGKMSSSYFHGVIHFSSTESHSAPAKKILVGLLDDAGIYQYQVIKHVYSGDNFFSLDTKGISFLLRPGRKKGSSFYSKLRIIIKDLNSTVQKIKISDVVISSSRCDERNVFSFDFDVKLSAGEIRKHLSSYWLKPLIEPRKTAGAYLESGSLSFHGGVEVGTEREGLNSFAYQHPTYVRRYHSLEHIRAILDELESLDKAHALSKCVLGVEKWLADYYESSDVDTKYVWYDHGTADRAVTLARLLLELCEHDVNKIFAEKLKSVIYRHMQALADPSFYLRNQRYRFHNHALFQDFSLYVCSTVFDGFLSRDIYQDLAKKRARSQFESLVSKEGVSLENSAGYHKGMLKFVYKAERIFTHTEADRSFYYKLKQGMESYLAVMRFPDGSLPAYGDTFRVLNSVRSLRLDQPIGSFFYPQAGYYIKNWKAHGHDCKLMVIGGSKTLVHKHKDNLSFVFYYAGIEWFMDPGFYSHGQDNESLYSKGAYCHNTIVLPGKHCLPQVGSCELAVSEQGDTSELKGVCFDYAGTEIRRFFSIDPESNVVRVENSILGSPNEALMCFQLGDGVRGKLEGDRMVLEHEKTSHFCIVDFLEGCSVSSFKYYSGQSLDRPEQFSGWSYQGTGEKVATETWVVSIDKLSVFRISLF